MLLQPFTFPDWPWGGDALTARLYSNVSWTDKNGIYRVEGEPGTKDFYQEFSGVVTGRSALFENFDTPATLSGLDRTDARVTMVLFDEDGVAERKTIFKNYITSDSLNPSTWPNFMILNKACPRRLGDSYLNAVRTYAAIQAALNALSANSFTASGLVLMVDGVVVVPEPLVTALSRVAHWSMSPGVIGNLFVDIDEIVPGVSFTIRSTNIGGDNGYVAWSISEP